jgi:hypothetical protein
LLVNNPTTDNITLEVGSTTQTVEVSAQAETLNTTDASLGIAFGEYQIKELPMEGRNVPDLLSLQAGVAYTGNRDRRLNTRRRGGAASSAVFFCTRDNSFGSIGLGLCFADYARRRTQSGGVRSSCAILNIPAR